MKIEEVNIGKTDVLWMLIVYAAFWGLTVSKINIQFSPEDFYPKKDSAYSIYAEHRSVFHLTSDENALYLYVENKNGVFERKFLNNVKLLHEKLKTIPGIHKLISIVNSDYYSYNHQQLWIQPVVHPDQIELRESDSLKLFNNIGYREKLLSKSGRGLILAIFPSTLDTDAAKRNKIEQIKASIAKSNFDSALLTGKPVFEMAYFDSMKEQLILYSLLSLIIALVILWLVYRNWSWTLLVCWMLSVPVLVYLMIHAIFKIPFDLVQINGLPIIVMLSLSQIVQLGNRYVQEIKIGVLPEVSLNHTIQILFPALLLTSITSCFGFLSLWSFGIPSIQLFGFITGLIVWFSLFFNLKVLRLVSKNFAILPKRSSGLEKWSQINRSILHFVFRNRILILVLFIFLMGISIWKSSMLRAGGGLTEELPNKKNIQKLLDITGRELGGLRSVEISIRPIGYKAREIAFLENLNRFQSELKNKLEISHLVSAVDFLKAASKLEDSIKTEKLWTYKSQADIDQAIEAIGQSPFYEEWDRYFNISENKLRLSGRCSYHEMHSFQKLSDEIKYIWKHGAYSNFFNYEITGHELMIEKTTQRMSSELWINLGLCLGGILLILWAYWKSFISAVMALLSLFPSLGFMGWYMQFHQIPLKPDHILLWSILSGILVDGGIHLVHGIRTTNTRNKSEQKDWIERTYQIAFPGLAIHYGIVLLGFICMLSSRFPASFGIGRLGAVSILTVLLSLLLFAPAILYSMRMQNRKK